MAEVLELAGKRGEAVPLIDEALLLYEQKGDVVSATRARKRREGALAEEPAKVTPLGT